MQERLLIEPFGKIHHPYVREFEIFRGGFGPIMGKVGEIKHEVEVKYSVKLTFKMKTFVVRIVGSNEQDMGSALCEVHERFGVYQTPIRHGI